MRKLIFYEWQKITNDLWILDTVKNGYKIEFSVFPNSSSFLPEIQFSTEKAEIVTAEVSKLLAKGAIKKVFAVSNLTVIQDLLVRCQFSLVPDKR